MKTVNIIFSLLFLALLSTSCGDDNDNPNESSLKGEWEATDFTLKATVTTSIGPLSSTIITDITGKDIDYTLNLDDTDYTTQGSYTMSVTATQDGQTFPVGDEVYEDISSDGAYTSTDNTVTISGVLFKLEGIDVPTQDGSDPNTMDYIIEGDRLTITDYLEINQSGLVSTVSTESKWVRK